MVHPDVIKSSNVLDVRQEFVQEYYDRSVHTAERGSHIPAGAIPRAGSDSMHMRHAQLEHAQEAAGTHGHEVADL